ARPRNVKQPTTRTPNRNMFSLWLAIVGPFSARGNTRPRYKSLPSGRERDGAAVLDGRLYPRVRRRRRGRHTGRRARSRPNRVLPHGWRAAARPGNLELAERLGPGRGGAQGRRADRAPRGG